MRSVSAWGRAAFPLDAGLCSMNNSITGTRVNAGNVEEVIAHLQGQIADVE